MDPLNQTRPISPPASGLNQRCLCSHVPGTTRTKGPPVRNPIWSMSPSKCCPRRDNAGWRQISAKPDISSVQLERATETPETQQKQRGWDSDCKIQRVRNTQIGSTRPDWTRDVCQHFGDHAFWATLKHSGPQPLQKPQTQACMYFSFRLPAWQGTLSALSFKRQRVCKNTKIMISVSLRGAGYMIWGWLFFAKW